MRVILGRYPNLNVDGERVFRSLCALLAENPAEVNWRGFSAADWSLLRELALSEGVAELAYYLLRSEPHTYQRAEFDPQVFQSWADQEAVTAVRNAILFKQLDRVLLALEEIDVPVVLLKGADLARSVYPQPGLRSMGDLDLLVPRSRYAEALAQVKRLGFEEFHPEASLRLDGLLSHNAHLQKAGPTSTVLEMHWTLVGTPAFRYAAPAEWFWEHVEPGLAEDRGQAAARRGVFALSPNAHLLYLAAHQMLQHGGEAASLRWFLDVHRLVTQRGAEIDWDALANQAGSFGWSGALRACFQAVKACFGTPLPEGFLEWLGTGGDAFNALVAEKSEMAETHTLAMWKTFRTLKWWGRVRLVLAMLFPGECYLCWRYQPRCGWSWPLYHIPLWGYIARDGWHTLWVLGYNRIIGRNRGGR